MGYRIKTVSDMLHVPRNTLLAWERRYQVVSPARQDNGYREYSEADVTRLREVKRLIDEGHKVSEAISMLEVRDLRQETRPPADLQRIPRALLDALLRFDRAAADEITRQLHAVSFRQQIDTIYFPMLHAVGEGWHDGDISIAQEHYVSAYCRERLLAMLISLECGPSSGPLVICAGYPTEQHDLSLVALSVLLAMRGKRVLFLGANVPAEVLRRLIREQQPSMTCISVMMPRPTDELLAFADVIGDAAHGRVVIGGRGLPADLPPHHGVEWHKNMSFT